jgi:hypothetical protein
LYVHRSDKNQIATEIAPIAVNAVETVAVMAVSNVRLDHVQSTKPVEKHIADITRQARGEYFTQALIHSGVRVSGDRLKRANSNLRNTAIHHDMSTH